MEAFYLRDPIALKPLKTNSSKLIYPPVDLVTVSILFTKVLYAQLKSQEFSAPPAWKDILPEAEKGTASDPLAQKKYAQLEMGMKVTSGFEMLVTDPKNADNRKVRTIQLLLDDLVADGISSLPADKEIAQWPDVEKEDDESWLDINFEDFERELEGKNKEKPGMPSGVFGPERPPGFGDANTQADLKKMVERFEAFLNDEDAGVEGVDMGDMDIDDDDNDDDMDDDSEDEDKDVSFNEQEFARMMREMMGMPSADAEEMTTQPPKITTNDDNRIEEVDSGDEDETSKIKKVMERMEAELNEAGALNLDPTPTKLAALKGKAKSTNERGLTAEDDSEEESDEEVNIDFNLAENILQSFKSQAGMAGPGGNLMGMMGMQLPRDEDEAGSSTKKT